MKNLLIFLILGLTLPLSAQDYFLKDSGPYDNEIISPETFLGYPIGFQHTRHDRIVDYLRVLGKTSENAQYIEYGRSYEGRILGMLIVSNPAKLNNLESFRQTHLLRCDPENDKPIDTTNPVIINLGYGVHGNEPSSAEAAMLMAYILVASSNPEIEKYRNESIIFIDPAINPDGRDRHTQWVNSFKGQVLIDDPLDIEHNEAWPRGRTNHYWFDLNRDWWLAIHPESRSKLNWYHKWYPNVVTDFHEMGSASTYFFEPMKDNGSKDPIMPKENYTTLNDKFGEYYAEALDDIGSFYFTKEVFDGTYPGYGSSYPDLQGGLGILFEQASSRGHLQKNDSGTISFPFTIRNQLITSLATVKASVENKQMLFDYQRMFFTSALENAQEDEFKAYVFGEKDDPNRLKAFLDKLLIHQVDVYPLDQDLSSDGHDFKKGSSFVVPVEQDQYRMVQSFFETYDEFQDSVFYDASAWSLANFYNIPYSGVGNIPSKGALLSSQSLNSSSVNSPDKAEMAYLLPWNDYNAPAALYYFQKKKLKTFAAFKSFSVPTSKGDVAFGPGTIMIPLSKQKLSPDEVHKLMANASSEFNLEIHAVNTSYSSSGVDLGSRYFQPLEKVKAVLLVGDGISSYEAGEIWHLLDQRIAMPITKVQMRSFNNLQLDNYNTLIMVSGSYSQLDSNDHKKIKTWIGKGNTLITQRSASAWAINNKIVNEKLVKTEKDEKKEEAEERMERLPWIDQREIEGKKSVGGTIFEVDLDISHPIGFGYTRRNLPVYRNSTIWLKPSKNPYSNVAVYTDDPHIDGFITKENLENKLKKSASIVVSGVGSGRVILFAENPNFRGSWYGTNKLFLNAVFFGSHINVPRVRD